jgi:hypothetical protein
MKLKTSLILLLALFTIMGCEVSPTQVIDNLEINRNVGFIKYSLMVEFVDAADPNTAPSNIQMTLEGAGAGGILESGGNKDFKVINGKIFLIVNPSAEPAKGESVDFTIKAKSGGYLPVNYQAHIVYGEELQRISIPMVNLSSPPTGVGHASGVYTLISGTLLGNQSISVNPSGEKITGATVQIPSGTTFYDLDGKVISGSDLKVDLTHFDAKGENSLASFPGGFTPNTVIGESGKPESIFFATAGFSSIDMTVGGKTVKGFNQPVHVSMSVSSLTNNLTTGKGIAAGDIIPIWSYDIESGVWQFEKSGKVVLENGELKINFDITHLTWYNLDFYGNTCPTYTTNCFFKTYSWYGYLWNYWTCVYTYTPPTGKITIISDVPTYEARFGELVIVKNNQIIGQKMYKVSNGSEIQFNNAPQELCVFKIYSGTNYYNKGTLLAESAPFLPCSAQFTLKVPLPKPVNVSIKASCYNNTKTLYPSFYVYYKPTNQNYYDYLTYINQGKGASSQLKIGSTYDFMFYFNNKEVKITKTVTSNDNIFDYQLDDDACEKIFR